jgi:hypothetical protein
MDNSKPTRNDIQLEYVKYIKNLDFELENYRKQFRGKKKITNLIYKESELLLESDEIEEIKTVKLHALKTLLEELEMNEDKEIIKSKNASNNNKILYPEVGDPEFGYKIYHKKEFNQFKIPKPKIENLNDAMIKKCSVRKMSETQKLLKTFISPLTPYNGLLVYHGVGVGKTCASISIAEEFMSILKENGKKIYVLVPPSIEDNYKNQIIDVSKIDREPDEIRKQCTMGNYMTDKFINKLKKMKKSDGKYDMEAIQKAAHRLINKNYEFMGYEKFVNMILDLGKDDSGIARRRKSVSSKNILDKKIKELFSDSIIIIDEAHNITMKTEDITPGGKKTLKQEYNQSNQSNQSKQSNQFETNSQSNLKTLKNTPKKVIKKKTLKKQIKKKTNKKGGAGNLEDNIHSLRDVKEKIDKLGKSFPPVIKKVLRKADNVKLILLSATPMFNKAEEIVDLMNLLLINDNKPMLNANRIFKNGDITEEGKNILINKVSGYVSYLRGENPINFPQKLYPLDHYVGSYPTKDINGKKLDKNDKIKFLKFINCEIGENQQKIYNKYFYENNESGGSFFDSIGLQICNVVFNKKDDELENISDYYGTKGFKNMFNIDTKKNGQLRFTFRNKLFMEMFQFNNLKNIACKIHKLINYIENSKGICFVYSQFKWAGVYPVAIALEMLGYSNYSGTNILTNSSNIKKNNKKYLLITGDSNEEFLKYKKREHLNKDGDLLKVILGTKAAGEGLNIYYVREVHVLEPWFHLNRLEQVIGRGIRNCSHKDLPEKERNVMVYLYTTRDKNDKERETLDMKLYRNAERKIEKVGKVVEILKSSAIDCHLNREGNMYLGDPWNKPIDMIDSQGKKRKVILEDKPYSSVCNYSETCNYKCYPLNKNLDEKMIDDRTYRIEMSMDLINDCISEIKNLYSTNSNNRVLFELFDIKEHLESQLDNLTNEIIFYAINKIVKDKIPIQNINGDEGYVIYRGNSKGNYYIFQPLNITEDIPVYMRQEKIKEKALKVKLDNLIGKKEIILKEKMKEERNKNYFTKILRFLRYIKELEIEEDGRLIIDKTVKKKKQKLSINLGSYVENTTYINNLLVEKTLDFCSYMIKSKIVEYVILIIYEYLKGSKNKNFGSIFEEINNISNMDLSRLRKNECIDYVREKIIIDMDLKEEEIQFDLLIKLSNLTRYIIINHLEYFRNRGYDKDLGSNFIGYKIANKGNMLYYYLKNDGIFDECNKNQIGILGTYKNEKRDKMRSKYILSKVYGFMETHGKNREMKFKIVDKIKQMGEKKTQIRTGYVCATDNIENIRGILKYLDTKNYINITGGKDLLCNSIELLMRFKNYREDKIYHFNLENFLIYFDK